MTTNRFVWHPLSENHLKTDKDGDYAMMNVWATASSIANVAVGRLKGDSAEALKMAWDAAKASAHSQKGRIDQLLDAGKQDDSALLQAISVIADGLIVDAQKILGTQK